jgi:uncharacterized membrane protein YphA (DoxX/SURF4 family)
MRSIGYRAEPFASAEALLTSSNLFLFDCVIADVDMPGMSGLSNSAGTWVPAPHLMGWLTILVELFGGLAVLLGALVPLASITDIFVAVEKWRDRHATVGRGARA